ncbi:MAG: 4-hydroxy-tetrahydrodipicolinate reductase [Candidatus Methanofastidiosia archaeon]
MKLAIIGYGRMGHEIQDVAMERGHSAVTIDPNRSDADFADISADSVEGCDVCIDFTHPSSAVKNIGLIASLKKPLVVGTTGWYDQMPHVREIIDQSGTGFLWSPNFSIGVNLYFRIISAAAQIFNNFNDYDVMGYELHHNGKADSPSGTAIKISQVLIENLKRKSTVVYEMLNRRPAPGEVHFASIRGGSNPGLHTVVFDSPYDTIEVSHQNRTRRGLAVGSVMAAEFIKDKVGFFDIEDLISDIIGE